MVLKLNFFQTLSTRVGQDFEVEFSKILKLELVQHFAADVL